MDVPTEIYDRNKRVVLALDLMKVNCLPFVVSTSLKIDLLTAEFIQDMKIAKLKEGVARAIRVYHNMSMADGQFDPVRGLLDSTDLNITAAQEHVLVIEQKIHVIKERFRASRSTLLFRKLPSHIIIKTVSFCVMWMNAQPSKQGVSDTFSPCEIMTKTQLDYSKHCKILFCSYCKEFQENQSSNSDVECTVDVICLVTTGNAQGGYK